MTPAGSAGTAGSGYRIPSPAPRRTTSPSTDGHTSRGRMAFPVRLQWGTAMSNDGEQCRYGKCECPRCRCGAALDSPQCEDYHRRHPYSKRGEK